LSAGQRKKIFKYPSLSPIYRTIGPNLGHADLNLCLNHWWTDAENFGEELQTWKKKFFFDCEVWNEI